MGLLPQSFVKKSMRKKKCYDILHKFLNFIKFFYGFQNFLKNFQNFLLPFQSYLNFYRFFQIRVLFLISIQNIWLSHKNSWKLITLYQISSIVSSKIINFKNIFKFSKHFLKVLKIFFKIFYFSKKFSSKYIQILYQIF